MRDIYKQRSKRNASTRARFLEDGLLVAGRYTAFSNNKKMNEWMKSRGWEDNRRALLQYILTREQ